MQNETKTQLNCIVEEVFLRPVSDSFVFLFNFRMQLWAMKSRRQIIHEPILNKISFMNIHRVKQ